MKQNIDIVCGYEYYGRTRIANSGEDCGWDYHYSMQTLSIYSQPKNIIPQLDESTLSVLQKIKSQHTRPCDFEEWDFAGNKAPNFIIDTEITKHICFLLNCLSPQYCFKAGSFNPASSDLVFNNGGIGERIYVIDDCNQII